MKECRTCGIVGDEHFYVSMPADCIACRTAERKTPEYRAKRRAWRLKAEYGLSVEAYESLVKGQDNRCAICKVEMEPPQVDHCHTKGHVRGLLCIHCNLGLGHFRDSPETLETAIEYLRING